MRLDEVTNIVYSNEDISIYKNPSRVQFFNQLNRSKRHELRSLVVPDAIYIWDSYFATHDDAEFWLNIKESDCFEVEFRADRIIYDYTCQDLTDAKEILEINAKKIKENPFVKRAYGTVPLLYGFILYSEGGYLNSRGNAIF